MGLVARTLAIIGTEERTDTCVVRPSAGMELFDRFQTLFSVSSTGGILSYLMTL